MGLHINVRKLPGGRYLAEATLAGGWLSQCVALGDTQEEATQKVRELAAHLAEKRGGKA